MSAVPVRELELDLDAFEGPFDLLLSLVLREELLRVDPAHHFAGLRLNAWVSIVCFVVASAAFVWVQRHGAEVEPRRPRRRAPPPGPKMAVPRGRVR